MNFFNTISKKKNEETNLRSFITLINLILITFYLNYFEQTLILSLLYFLLIITSTKAMA